MKAIYYPWGIAGGMLALAMPGTSLWTLPVLGALVHMAYDTDPPAWQARGARLLEQAQRLELPARVRARTLPHHTSEQAPPSPSASPVAAGDELLDTLEAQPHRLIIGHTRGGKTTLIHSMATGWAEQGARVLVCDPDAAPGQWPGCRVVGAGDNFTAIAEGLTLVAVEVQKRRALRAQGQRTFKPLHLVIDEAQDTVAEVPSALEVIEDVARRGGKLNVRLTLGVQDKQVATLGLTGKSHLLRNFVTADVFKGRDGQRVAQLRDSVSKEKIVLPIPQLPDPEAFIVERAALKVAVQNAPEPAHGDALLASLLAASEQAGTASQSAGTKTAPAVVPGSHMTPEPGTMMPEPAPSAGSGLGNHGNLGTTVRLDEGGRTITINNTLSAPVGREQRTRRPSGGAWAHRRRSRTDAYQQVRQLVAQGKKPGEIAKLVHGRRQEVLALVRRAKAEMTQQA